MARMPLITRWGVAALLALVLIPAAAAASSPSANTAALQVALKALHHYRGSIDGIAGPRTKGAVKQFQRKHHLTADGVAGPQTRRAMGRRGSPLLGTRVMHVGNRGWDVAALQFMLRRRGFSAGSVDGGYGPNTRTAGRRFQAPARPHADGAARPRPVRAPGPPTRQRSSAGSGRAGHPARPGPLPPA